MWQEFLDASLRDNLILISSIIGSLGGLSFFLSLGWLRRARNSSQTILALEDENRQFRADFARAQVRLDKVDPEIIGTRLAGQDRLDTADARLELAETYLRTIAPAAGPAALARAENAIFSYSRDPGAAINTATRALDAAEQLYADPSEIARLRAAVTALRSVVDIPDTPLRPEVYDMQDPEIQVLANTEIEAGNIPKALFLATLCADKDATRTGHVSSNHAAALTSLGVAQRLAGNITDALATNARCRAIYDALHGGPNPHSLSLEANHLWLQARHGDDLGGDLDQFLGELEALETRILAGLGDANNAAMVHLLDIRAEALTSLGRDTEAESARQRAIAIHDFLRVQKSTDPATLELLYDPR